MRASAADGLTERGRLYLERARQRLLRPGWLLPFLAAILLAVAARHELRTSALQSYLLSSYARRLSYTIETGPSPLIVFPKSGPFDRHRGYSLLPEIQRRLEGQGYRVAEQAHLSPAAARLAEWGIAPPFREPAAAGLLIRGADGQSLYDAMPGDQIFQRFEDIPPLVVNALLFIENRELAQQVDPRQNPAVDWGRFAKAGFLYAESKLGLSMRIEGGSTLATQIEKFRHSPHGRTNSMFDKLRQMTAASLKVYREGSDTRPARREIIVDYLNSMPLAGAPGYGEVNGLGQGLRAWFGMDLDDVRRALEHHGDGEEDARAFKNILALLYAVHAPTYYLVEHRSALEARVESYANLLQAAGVIDSDFRRRLQAVRLHFVQHAPARGAFCFADRKATNSIREELTRLLGMRDLYDLDRLHLEVDSTIDSALQESVVGLFRQLRRPQFLEENGLREERLLAQGDPREVVYSLLLLERSPEGNLLRVHADSLDKPFDTNEGMKLELGSTAKLRTLAHYLDLTAKLHDELSGLDGRSLRHRVLLARDPITLWAAETLAKNRRLDLDTFLDLALERTYSASPAETFFTGGGEHIFQNFDPRDNGRIMTIKEAVVHSTNLVFIRLMRDIVRFHAARLPYDAQAVLEQSDDPVRHRLLEDMADEESHEILSRAYRRLRNLSAREVESRLLKGRSESPKNLAILFFAWHPGSGMEELSDWLASRMPGITQGEIRRLERAYGDPRLTLADHGYLLRLHPLEIWCAGELVRTPGLSREELLARSKEAAREASSWLFKTANRGAQGLRLRTRIEQDAFARMTPYWRRLGFPFERLVPSYATAIGSSSDRPVALAELMGIILNDGVLRQVQLLQRLRFAPDTPYHTVLEPVPQSGEQVMKPEVARTLRALLTEVVQSGTARRVNGAFVETGGTPVPVGGKTGSGDNRYDTFDRGGRLISSRSVSRTAAFVFYIGDRYFGVITASVAGPDAKDYAFTSALPLAVLKLLAPEINQRLARASGSVAAAVPTRPSRRCRQPGSSIASAPASAGMSRNTSATSARRMST
ncbi:MAG: glycosyl transferase family 51 [Acidobacteria bacterium]|nr:MAG: glycosyl transferase family 51 [Acidobacteriota bacterium]